MLAMWGLDTQQNPTYSRLPESFTLFAVGWLFWFVLNFWENDGVSPRIHDLLA
jgi:hypothetical protein